MPGKNKDKKKKKGKDRDMSPTVAAALMPVASMAAAPRSSPPPPPEVAFARPGSASAVLASSLLSPVNTMVNTFNTETEGIRSDTDTSLYDYENARPTYSSMDFRGTSTGELSYRGPIPLPHENGLHDSYEDDYSGSPRYSSVDVHNARPRSASPSGEPLYAQVRKGRGGRKSHSEDDVRTSVESGPMSSSMRRYAEEDERSLRQTGQSSRRSTLRSTGRSPSPTPCSAMRSPSPKQSMEVRLESMISHNVARGASPMSTGERSVRGSRDLAHSSSLKLKTLEIKNTELIAQQQKQQQLFAQQLKMQEEVMQRLADRTLLLTQGPEETMRDPEMGSLLHDTQSVTEATMTHQASMLHSMQTRTAVLEQEKRELQDLNEQLQAEINSLRRLASIKDTDGDGIGTQVLLMKKQLQDFKDERDTLKSSVHRMTAELSRYQAKYRTPPAGEQEETLGLPSRGPTPSWLINTKYLAPLFLAYDDRLAEKDAILQDLEEEMDHFRERMEEVIKENSRLHIRLEQTDTAGPISMTEWRQLQEQCRLVLEENQLLMEQLDLQQNKAKDMHKAHVQEVSRLSKKLVLVESERSELHQRVSDVKDNYRDVKAKHDAALVDGAVKMEVEDHLAATSRLKRALEDEQNKNTTTLENLQTKIVTLEAEKRAQVVDLEDVKKENRQLTAELKLLNKGQRKSLRKMLILQRALEEVETKELSTSKYLNTVVKVAEKTAHERDTLVQVAQKQDRQRKKAISKVMQGNVTAARMEEKLKLVKLKAHEKLANLANRMKELDEDFNMRKSEYEREIKHLRLLLREREDMLESVAGEKRCVEDDLETMWQVASADNRRMRETYRKSVRKLKEHVTLDAIISDSEEDKKYLLNMADQDT